jgi:class 3 adenylate cyclase
MKRFHRVIRAVGSLKVRAVSKRVWEVMRFAQEERLHELEAESILTLCRIGSKNVLLEMRGRLDDPETSPEVKAALIRGARYMPPGDVVEPLLAQLFVPEGAGANRALVLETMREMDLSGSGEVPGALVKLFSMKIAGREKEIASVLLERYADAPLFQPLVALSGGTDPVHKRCAVRALASLALREKGVPVDVLTHRLYLLLRDPDETVRIESLFALLDLNDDYAQKILKEWLSGERDAVRAAIIRRLRRPLPNDLLILLVGLLRSESAEIHKVLREVLPVFCRDKVCEEVQRAVLSYLETEQGAAGLETKIAAKRDDRKGSIIHQPKIEFKFRMEHSQVLTVFFIDVVDYTARSTRVDMSSLMQFVRTFEETVIPFVEEYNGTVVKKLGDGILAAFLHPLAAVLASLAIQQEVKDHNRFAVEEDRFLARIGLHTGSVIRKEGDIYGDVVNIASRMQQAAQPGMVLMTEATHREVKDFIVGRSLGRIKVKGVSEGVVAFALEKVRPEVAEALEMRKGGDANGTSASAEGSRKGKGAGGGNGREVFMRLEESLFTPTFRVPKESASSKDAVSSKEPAARDVLPLLRGMFQDMSKAVEEIAGDYHEEYVFKAYLQNKWEEILQKLNGRPG